MRLLQKLSPFWLHLHHRIPIQVSFCCLNTINWETRNKVYLEYTTNFSSVSPGQRPVWAIIITLCLSVRMLTCKYSSSLKWLNRFQPNLAGMFIDFRKFSFISPGLKGHNYELLPSLRYLSSVVLIINNFSNIFSSESTRQNSMKVDMIVP